MDGHHDGADAGSVRLARARARRRMADVLATAAMGSWLVLAVMPVVVVIVALA